MNGINAIKITEPEKDGLDDLPLEDFISKVEDEILDDGIDRGKSNSDFLNNFITKRNKVLQSIKEEKKRDMAASLFGARETLIMDAIEKEKGKGIEQLKILYASWQQRVIRFVNRNPDQKELESFWEEYDALFSYYGPESEQRGEKLKSGILGTLATQKFLTSRDFEARYPTPEEDVRDMVDLVASDEKNKTNFLIQIKVRNKKVKEMGQNGGVSNDNEDIPYFDFEKEEIAKVFNEEQFKTPGAEIKEGNEYDLFRLGCFKYTQEHKEYFQKARKKGYQTKGLYLYVPYSINGVKAMDEFDGAPKDDFINTLKGGKIEDRLGIVKNK